MLSLLREELLQMFAYSLNILVDEEIANKNRVLSAYSMVS